MLTLFDLTAKNCLQKMMFQVTRLFLTNQRSLFQEHNYATLKFVNGIRSWFRQNCNTFILVRWVPPTWWSPIGSSMMMTKLVLVAFMFTNCQLLNEPPTMTLFGRTTGPYNWQSKTFLCIWSEDTIFTEKTIDVSGIRTRIDGSEGKHADHLTTTTAL